MPGSNILYKDELISFTARYALIAALWVSPFVYFYLVHSFRGAAVNKVFGHSLTIAMVVGFSRNVCT